MQEIAICDLKPSKENVRKTKASDESMERLIASIKSKGLLKNLVVKKNGTGYFVTDGNRRLQALQEIYGSNSGEAISCKILDDDANELEIGLHANTMHEHMHPLDECEAIDHIVEGGEMDYSGIALQFGQTERWVAQRVGLSQLSPLAKEKFRAMEFVNCKIIPMPRAMREMQLTNTGLKGICRMTMQRILGEEASIPDYLK